MSLPSDMDGDLGIDNADDAFLKHFLSSDEDVSERKPSDQGQVENEDDSAPADEELEDDASDESPEDGDDSDEDSGDEKAKQKKFADDGDDTYVKVKVGDEDHEVPVKELKRLWGQETALNQKSQKVAEQRKAVEAEQTRYEAAASLLLERAMARFEPYSKVDFVLAAKELTPEEYTALRTEAQKAYDDVQFLQAGINEHVQNRAIAERQALIDQARETVKLLSGDPKDGGIEGWSEKLYDDIRGYAVTQGVPADVVNTLVDPSAIRILHKAMLFDRGKSTVKTTKVKKSPTKVIKTTTSSDETASSGKNSKLAKAAEKHRREGSVESARDAFLAAWATDDD